MTAQQRNFFRLLLANQHREQNALLDDLHQAVLGEAEGHLEVVLVRDRLPILSTNERDKIQPENINQRGIRIGYAKGLLNGFQ